MGVKTSPACSGIEKSNIQVLNYPALLRLCWVLCVHAKSEWLSFCLKERKNPEVVLCFGEERQSGGSEGLLVVVEVGLQEGGTPPSHIFSLVSTCIPRQPLIAYIILSQYIVL